MLPIGLSFHTFQSLSYVIEVYKGNQKAEKHLGIYSLYVMFYPQLVTGPIERPQNLLIQLREKQYFKYSNLVEGLRLILFGLFTKMVIAYNLAVYVDQIYSDPTKFNSLSILIGLIFYSFQIYCDFYGYSTIAVGSAKAMGFNLIDNFKNPYISKNIGEFWNRWHISLSTWFRDYVYIPLGGNRVKLSRFLINILIVFVLSGLWHGANWTFILWGLTHAVVYMLEFLFNKFIRVKSVQNKVIAIVVMLFKILKTFLIVSLIWVLFRASDVANAKTIFNSLISNFDITDAFSVDGKIWFFLIAFLIFDLLLINSRFDKWCNNQAVLLRWSIYAGLIFSILVFSSVTNFPFIYFQF